MKPGKYNVEIGGFVIAPDLVIQDVGLVSACVYGRIWRYEQMDDGVCKAALQTISNDLGVSYNTVLGHIDRLLNAGYITDLTPELRNRPHIYKTTGKLKIEIGIKTTPQFLESETKSTPQKLESTPQILGTHSSKIGDESESLIESIKREEEEEEKRPAIFAVYEQEIGPLTPMIAQSLGDLEKEHTFQWTQSAIREASKNGARNLAYITAILRRWKIDGYGSENRKTKSQKAQPQAHKVDYSKWGE